MKTSLLVPIVILCISGCPNKPFSTKPGGIEEPMGDLRTYMSANALIGSWGQKTGTYKKLYQIGLKRNGFQRSGIGDWNNVGIIEIASFDIDSENRKNIEKLGLEYKELVEASTSLSRARTDKYKVVFVQVADFGDLVKAIKERIIKDPDSDFSFNIKNKGVVSILVTLPHGQPCEVVVG